MWDNSPKVLGYFSRAGFWDGFDPEITVLQRRTSLPYVSHFMNRLSNHVDHVARIGPDNCRGGNGMWRGNEVDLEYNIAYLNDFTTHQWSIITAHELGHAYGLAHQTEVCSLMVPTTDVLFDDCAGVAYFIRGPTSFDIDGVVSLYPVIRT